MTTGINTGFLYKMGQGALYFIDENGESSPFSNPKFKEAFEKTNHIAFLYLDKIDWDFSSDQTFLEEVAKETRKHLQEKKVEEYNKKLLEKLKNTSFSSKLETWKEKPAHEQFILLFGAYFLAAEAFSRERASAQTGPLRKAAEEAGKKVSVLVESAEMQEFASWAFLCLSKMALVYPMIDQMIESPALFEVFLGYNRANGQAWNLGAASAYDRGRKDSFVSEEVLGSLKSAYQGKKVEFTVADLSEMQEFFATYNKKVADKVEALLSNNSNILFFAKAAEKESLLKTLADRSIGVEGPLGEQIKPRGLLWEIQKAEKVVGYFLASIHVTPRWLLENFNSKILEAFASCDTLGVEVDMTRDGVEEQLSDGNNPFAANSKQEKQCLLGFIKEGLNDCGIIFEEGDSERYIQEGWKKLVKAHQVDSGIDLYFTEKAKKRGMTIVDLESIETHKGFIDRFVPKANWKSGLSKELYRAWKEELEENVLRNDIEIFELGATTLLENMFKKANKEIRAAGNIRNIEMAMSVHKLIEKGKKPFAIAGEMHFAGKQGMCELMKSMGYGIKQVICEERIQSPPLPPEIVAANKRFQKRAEERRLERELRLTSAKK